MYEEVRTYALRRVKKDHILSIASAKLPSSRIDFIDLSGDAAVSSHNWYIMTS